MDITQVGIDALDGLAIEHCLQTEHTMGGRMLRTNIDYELIICEELILTDNQFAVLIE